MSTSCTACFLSEGHNVAGKVDVDCVSNTVNIEVYTENRGGGQRTSVWIIAKTGKKQGQLVQIEARVAGRDVE